ncbi:hypothetical protein ABZU75_00390 [Streptosporangium sp. NPDC005286]|uniref:hypothetical protein n=1 Tax=Streptosporangium sp. NPDC005286 TaxID=3154463 RepID=UPI0033A8EFFC
MVVATPRGRAPTADYEIPDDPIEAQRAYGEADAAVQEMTDALSPSTAIVAGEAEITDKQRQRLAEV